MWTNLIAYKKRKNNEYKYQEVTHIKSRPQKNDNSPADYIEAILKYKAGKLSRNEKAELKLLKDSDEIVFEAFRLDYIVDNILKADLFVKRIENNSEFEIIDKKAKYLIDKLVKGATDLWEIRNDPEYHLAEAEDYRFVDEYMMEKEEKLQKEKIARQKRNLLALPILAAAILLIRFILKFFNF